MVSCFESRGCEGENLPSAKGSIANAGRVARSRAFLDKRVGIDSAESKEKDDSRCKLHVGMSSKLNVEQKRELSDLSFLEKCWFIYLLDFSSGQLSVKMHGPGAESADREQLEEGVSRRAGST